MVTDLDFVAIFCEMITDILRSSVHHRAFYIMNETERLNKFLASKGVASRRKAEELVRSGRVKVNGRSVFSPGFPVDPIRDKIQLDGDEVGRGETAEGHTYIMLNKPRGVITTASDEYGRRNVLDIVRPQGRLFPVGRLDKNSEGLVLLTDDGALAYRLTHPKFEVKKTYDVVIKGRLDVSKVRRGKVRILYSSDLKTRLHITIHEGRKRQIRLMFGRLGYPVVKLKRIAMGPLRLGGLKKGQFRPLTDAEMKKLKRAAG